MRLMLISIFVSRWPFLVMSLNEFSNQMLLDRVKYEQYLITCCITYLIVIVLWFYCNFTMINLPELFLAICIFDCSVNIFFNAFVGSVWHIVANWISYVFDLGYISTGKNSHNDSCCEPVSCVVLTLCGLVMPYANKYQGQLWLR